jgi:cytidylate kinase
MRVITISSEFGAGGPLVGRELAKNLGLDYVDKEIIHRIALGLQVPEEKVKAFDEVQYSRLRTFLSTVFDFDALKGHAGVTGEVPEGEGRYDDREEIPFDFRVKGWIDREVYRQMIVKILTAVGEGSGGVIKGRGSQVVLKDHPRALHVRFVADLEDRIAHTAERHNLPPEEAREMVQRMDKRGEDYVRTYFQRDLKDPTLYHLVLNSSRLPLHRCRAFLEGMARELLPEAGS